MSPTPESTSFDIEGATIAALRWPGLGGPPTDGTPTVVAIHGITANAWSWDPVAHASNGDFDLVAVDLRGRGRSWTQPGPVGLRQHADDVAAVIEQLGGPVVVVGHSMGTYVALLLAERHPAAVRSLVLVDGGTALYLPDPPVRDDGTVTPKDEFIDKVLDVSLGPAIERLERVWPDQATYRAMWAQHPAYVDGIGAGPRTQPARRPHRDRRRLPDDGRPGRRPPQWAGVVRRRRGAHRRSIVIRSRPR